MSRQPYATIASEGFRHVLAPLNYLVKSPLGENLLNLVYLRISQINGCPCCIDLYWPDSRKSGEDGRRLNALKDYL